MLIFIISVTKVCGRETTSNKHINRSDKSNPGPKRASMTEQKPPDFIVDKASKRKDKKWHRMQGKPQYKQLNKIRNSGKGSMDGEADQQVPVSIPSASVPMSPQWVKGVGSLRADLTKTATMIGRSKEEKFSMDVEVILIKTFCPLNNSDVARIGVYREVLLIIVIQMQSRNRDAFDRDVQKFLKEEGKSIRRMPVWKSMPVSLYELFITVYDRGGYHKVRDTCSYYLNTFSL